MTPPIVVDTSTNPDTTTRINMHEPWKEIPATVEEDKTKMRKPAKNKMRTAHQDKGEVSG